jgi:hypothetical protein
MSQETSEPTKAFEDYRGVAITCHKVSGLAEFSCTLPGPMKQKLVAQTIGGLRAMIDIAMAGRN